MYRVNSGVSVHEKYTIIIDCFVMCNFEMFQRRVIYGKNVQVDIFLKYAKSSLKVKFTYETISA